MLKLVLMDENDNVIDSWNTSDPDSSDIMAFDGILGLHTGLSDSTTKVLKTELERVEDELEKKYGSAPAA